MKNGKEIVPHLASYHPYSTTTGDIKGLFVRLGVIGYNPSAALVRVKRSRQRCPNLCGSVMPSGETRTY